MKDLVMEKTIKADLALDIIDTAFDLGTVITVKNTKYILTIVDNNKVFMNEEKTSITTPEELANIVVDNNLSTNDIYVKTAPITGSLERPENIWKK